MTEQEAEAEAKRRNLELGAQGQSSTYWVSVETGDGGWTVERRDERPSLARRIWRAVLEHPGP